MGSTQNRRLSPKVIRADEDSYQALLGITDYSPSNPDFSVGALQDAYDAMFEAQKSEVQVNAASAAKRDGATAAEWRFHNLILCAKDQVIAQYGFNSDQVQSLGLKKKSERKRPTRKNGNGST